MMRTMAEVGSWIRWRRRLRGLPAGLGICLLFPAWASAAGDDAVSSEEAAGAPVAFQGYYLLDGFGYVALRDGRSGEFRWIRPGERFGEWMLTSIDIPGERILLSRGPHRRWLELARTTPGPADSAVDARANRSEVTTATAPDTGNPAASAFPRSSREIPTTPRGTSRLRVSSGGPAAEGLNAPRTVLRFSPGEATPPARLPEASRDTPRDAFGAIRRQWVGNRVDSSVPRDDNPRNFDPRSDP